MMLGTLPPTAETFGTWTWEQIAPYYDDLLARSLTAENLDRWLTDWSQISTLVDEANTRFTIATTVNTADEQSQQHYATFLDNVMPHVLLAEQQVKQKLLQSELEPGGFEMPLRRLRADAALFHEANVPLLAEARKLSLEYDKLSGARSVTWEGVEIPWVQLYPVLESPNRDRREHAWRVMSARILEDSGPLASLWRQMIAVRGRIAENAGFETYRSYRWQQLYRFDYTPDDAKRFHKAIEDIVVPAARRINEQRRRQLGIATIRPWDEYVDPRGREPLHPYQTIEELESKTSAIFHHVDPELAEYFETMRTERLLDLDSRKNKASGGYSLCLNAIRRPFIFANAVGTHGDVQTLLHEGGHAFHSFEMAYLPYLQQRQEEMLPMEFLEVASMSMELLASPYLTTSYGGFYTEAEASRARVDNLQRVILFWPYMAAIDALQHWIYEHEDDAGDLAACDDQWAKLIDRFTPDTDWSGLDAEKHTFWHQQSHVFQDPFYYIEYGMAQLAAVQIWAQALSNQTHAVKRYRQALALGGTISLPQLYATAGARFVFDADTLGAAVQLIESTIAQLEPLANG